MERNLVKILNRNVDTFNFDDALTYIMENKGHIVTINPEMIEYSQKDEVFAKIVDNASLIIPDGIGVQLGLKILGYNVSRIPGIEFGKALVSKCVEQNLKIAMVGAKHDVIKLAIFNFKREYPNIDIVYSHDGYFDDEQLVQIDLIQTKPDLVLVALGSPKQEIFINAIKRHLPHSIFIGLGGSFDVWAGVVKRAPKIYQEYGLEWLYRTISEPERIKRIFPTLPLFVLKVLKERIFKHAK